jgi:hypothetical protein
MKSGFSFIPHSAFLLLHYFSGPNASRDYIIWDDAESLDDFSRRPRIIAAAT